jgi:hypothetical protein
MDTLPIILFYIITILAWLIPMLVALLRLRHRTWDETAKAVWVLVIVLLPLIGPITFFLMNDNRQKQ